MIAVFLLPQAKVNSILMVHNFDVVINIKENEGCEWLEIAFFQDSKQCSLLNLRSCSNLNHHLHRSKICAIRFI